MARISFCTLVIRAWSGRSMTRGTTTAARMPRMTTTTMTSIKVKPRCARDAFRTVGISIDQLVEFKDGQQDGQYNNQYHTPHCQDQQGFEHTHDHRDAC